MVILPPIGQFRAGLIHKFKIRKSLVMSIFRENIPQGYDPVGIALGGVDAVFFAANPAPALPAKGANGSRPGRPGRIATRAINQVWHWAAGAGK